MMFFAERTTVFVLGGTLIWYATRCSGSFLLRRDMSGGLPWVYPRHLDLDGYDLEGGCREVLEAAHLPFYSEICRLILRIEVMDFVQDGLDLRLCVQDFPVGPIYLFHDFFCPGYPVLLKGCYTLIGA